MLVQDASNQIHNIKTSNRTMVAFFDYEKAYDKVWRVGLLHKMQKMKLPARFIRFTRNFLSGRQTQVEVNGGRSKTFRLDEGLPQGSSISPILFLIFINDIDVDLDCETMAKPVRQRYVRMEEGILGSNCKLMQNEINKIIDWAKRWKMRVNTDKTKAMII